MIDTAHQGELGVILDVVYNHFPGDGNYLAEFSPLPFKGTDGVGGRSEF